MNESILELVNRIKSKCLENDCAIYNQLNLSQAEYQFFMSCTDMKKLETGIIAANMGITMSRFSRVVDKMVKNGYLRRTINKKDRRAINLTFTETGKKIKQQLLEYKTDCEQKILNNLTPQEIQEVKLNLQKLIDKL